MKRILLLSIILLSLTAQAATKNHLTFKQIDAKCVTHKTKKQAFICVQKLAKQGDAVAQFALGYMYAYGKDVIKKNKELLSLLTKAAKQGDAYAQFALGYIYADGQGIKQDYKEALSWYTKAAKQGYVKAQLLLGAMYKWGQGTKENDIKAYAWYLIARSDGDGFVQTLSQDLESKMTSEEIKQAQALAAKLSKEIQANLATHTKK